MIDSTKEREEVVMSFVSFEQSRDIIQAAADKNARQRELDVSKYDGEHGR
jgi:hypothetical protein